MKSYRLIPLLVLSISALWSGTIRWSESVPVTRSKPVYRMVTIRTPYEVCYDRRVPVRHNDGAVVPAALIGAVAGGILGHQVGRGHGRDAATIGGAAAGALMGATLMEGNRRPHYRHRQVCETRYRRHRERRLIHYKNIAWYQGRKIVKFSKRPLRRITLRLRADY